VLAAGTRSEGGDGAVSADRCSCNSEAIVYAPCHVHEPIGGAVTDVDALTAFIRARLDDEERDREAGARGED
jgi:hypothetical protein